MRGVRFVTSMGSRLEILEQPFSVIRVIFRVTPPAFSCDFMQVQCHKRISDCICLLLAKVRSYAGESFHSPFRFIRNEKFLT